MKFHLRRLNVVNRVLQYSNDWIIDGELGFLLADLLVSGQQLGIVLQRVEGAAGAQHRARPALARPAPALHTHVLVVVGGGEPAADTIRENSLLPLLTSDNCDF